MKQNIYPLLLW